MRLRVVPRRSYSRLEELGSGVVLGVGIAYVVVHAPREDGVLQGIVALVGILIYLIFSFLRGGRAGPPARVSALVLAAFLVRAAFAFLHHFVQLLPPLYYLDALVYDQYAWALADSWVTDVDPGVPIRGLSMTVFVYLSAGVYRVIGHSVLTLKMISALLGALSIYHLFVLAQHIVGYRRAYVLALLLTIWPSHIFWTSNNFRDPWVYYFLARSLHASVRWWSDGHIVRWLASTLFALLTSLFSLYLGMILWTAIGGATLWRALRRWPRGVAVPAFCLVILATVAVTRLVPETMYGYSLEFSATALAQKRQDLAGGSSPIYPELTYNSWLEALQYAPRGITSFLFAPYPWQTQNTVQLLASLENISVYVFVILGLVRLRSMRPVWRGETSVIWMFMAFGILLYGLTEGNIGTAFRHKMVFLPNLLMMLSVTWGRTRAFPRPDGSPG